MDKNQKFLKRLSTKEFSSVEKALHKINVGDTKNLDIKKLTGYQDVYRVRIKTIRIIFLINENRIDVLEISRRNEKTYKKF